MLALIVPLMRLGEAVFDDTPIPYVNMDRTHHGKKVRRPKPPWFIRRQRLGPRVDRYWKHGWHWREWQNHSTDDDDDDWWQWDDTPDEFKQEW